MKFKGTKGEWEVSDKGIYKNEYGVKTMSINFEEENAIECIELYIGIDDDDELSLEANAKLIAAAPELLEALQETEKDLCVLWGQMLHLEKTNPIAEGLSDLIDGWRNRNKQAINKALK